MDKLPGQITDAAGKLAKQEISISQFVDILCGHLTEMAREEGRTARLNGLTIQDCPHNDVPLVEGWERGFNGG